MSDLSPYPIVLANGFTYFQIGNSQVAAIRIDGKMTRASSFPPQPVDDRPMEPGPLALVRALVAEGRVSQ